MFKGHKVHLLRQVDDLMIQIDDKNIGKEIFIIIGSKLQLENEDEPPLAYMVLLSISTELILSRIKRISFHAMVLVYRVEAL